MSAYEKAKASKASFVELSAERKRTNDALMAAWPGFVDRLIAMKDVNDLVAIIRDGAVLAKPAFLAEQALENFRSSSD